MRNLLHTFRFLRSIRSVHVFRACSCCHERNEDLSFDKSHLAFHPKVQNARHDEPVNEGAKTEGLWTSCINALANLATSYDSNLRHPCYFDKSHLAFQQKVENARYQDPSKDGAKTEGLWTYCINAPANLETSCDTSRRPYYTS